MDILFKISIIGKMQIANSGYMGGGGRGSGSDIVELLKRKNTAEGLCSFVKWHVLDGMHQI